MVVHKINEGEMYANVSHIHFCKHLVAKYARSDIPAELQKLTDKSYLRYRTLLITTTLCDAVPK